MTFVDQFNTTADTLMTKLRERADGKTVVNLFKEFNQAALDAIAQVTEFENNNSNTTKTLNNLFGSKHIQNKLYAMIDRFRNEYGQHKRARPGA